MIVIGDALIRLLLPDATPRENDNAFEALNIQNRSPLNKVREMVNDYVQDVHCCRAS